MIEIYEWSGLGSDVMHSVVAVSDLCRWAGI